MTRYKIYYRTKAGEDLAQVSEKFDVSEDQLRLWNALKATHSIIPGQVLVINKSTGRTSLSLWPKHPPLLMPKGWRRQPKRSETTQPPRRRLWTDRMTQTDPTTPWLQGEEPTPELPENVSDEPVDETVHIVQEGESLSTIGQEHGVSWLALEAWNDIEPPGPST